MLMKHFHLEDGRMTSMQAHDIKLQEEEDDVAGFFGVHIKQRDDCAKLMEKGFAQCIIKAL